MPLSYTDDCILAYHGCDLQIAEQVFSGTLKLRPSENGLDMLGKGTYFWPQGPSEALLYARHMKTHPEMTYAVINQPAALGARIRLGHHLDLSVADNWRVLYKSELAELAQRSCRFKIKPDQLSPLDRSARSRFIHYALLEAFHTIREQAEQPPINTIYGKLGARDPAKRHVYCELNLRTLQNIVEFVSIETV